ncbi:MAG TPA: phenylalanine--tRNA ligase subunit beta [Thermoanaerobaculia bacterium]|nr:phenylalanine--tRNA ligase subunit beta [Thermoanaerobaculia bacterium]
MRLVYNWLREIVPVTVDVDAVAHEIGLRGFEVAGVEYGPEPVIDFEITANRPDCLSHLGLAREASAIWGLPAVVEISHVPVVGADPESDATLNAAGGSFDVRVDAPDLCPRYCAQLFSVKVAPSPDWLQRRLEAAGVRPINNVVDVTNYVMLELGQPMHAFDLERLTRHRIVVRRANAKETMRTLDGVDRALDADMLVIADADRAVAIGGVMGGANSEIAATTTTIALESAYFEPTSVRSTSKRLGLKTEASTRFERGGDIEMPPLGISRAAQLFVEIRAGIPSGYLIDHYPVRRPARTIALRSSRIARLLGQAVPAADVPRYLEPLGFDVHTSAAREQEWNVTIPSFRVDVTREEDLIEEVGRHYGFDRLPVRFPVLASAQAAPDPRIARDRLLRQALTSAGFSESMTFAFIERQAAIHFCESGTEPVAIANPLSEKFAVLRPSLLAGLTDSCAHNRRRGRRDVQLFEIGSRFSTRGEGRAVAFAWTGAASGPHWSGASRQADFFDAKGVVELLGAAFGTHPLDFSPSSEAYLVRGRAAEVRSGTRLLGVVGQLAPKIAEARGLPVAEEIFVAEIDSDALGRASAPDELRAETLPRFPSIVRDVSILVDEVLPAASVRGTIRAAAPPTLVSIVEFDRYQGKGVPDGRVSLSLRLTFRDPERTLTDDDAQTATEHIVEALRNAHGAERR